jgi:hypothetical protein
MARQISVQSAARTQTGQVDLWLLKNGAWPGS